jgi:hypothetical protein
MVMETTEIARLQNEIARLNSIIDALVTENRLLKNQIADDKKSDATLNVPFAHDNNQVGNLNNPIAHDKNTVGNFNHPFANENILIGNLNHPLAEEKKMIGNLNTPIANDNSYYGKSDNNTAVVKTVVPAETHFAILAKYLKGRGMKKSSREGRTHAAKLLLYFYHQSRGDYKTLMKASGLSYFGLGKTIGKLKKRGWLIRSGWQQFALTDVARKMLEVGCGGIKA